jgi:glycosidase
MRNKFRLLNWLVIAALVVGVLPVSALSISSARPKLPQDVSTITLDGVRDADYVKIATDPLGDLGPCCWSGIDWTDLTSLYVAADATNLYVYVDSNYQYTVSAGQIGLALDVDGQPYSGGVSDPWGNAITFDYNNVDGATTAGKMQPDYVVRGNVINNLGGNDAGNGWTELRRWQSGNWNTGSSVNWGGITGSNLIGTHIAYSNTQGVEFAIPLADIGQPDPAKVHVQFFTTQGGGSKGAYDTLPSDDQATGWDDATFQHNLVSVPVAIDPAGDSVPGNAWSGVAWTDLTRLHLWADHNSLHVFIPSATYSRTVSTGQIALAIDTKPGGGSGDAWGNAITFAYTTTWQNLGHAPIVTTTTILPDYLIRGNIFNTLGGSDAGNGWTEFRTWNGSDWNTGGGVDWGGIGNSGQPSLPGSRVAWQDNNGLRLTIPFSNLGVSAGNTINLEFIATQGGGAKGAYDTVPADDQSTGWDDATTQQVLASYTIPAIPAPGASHDNNIFWDDLGHNSRDALYRNPLGAVTTNTTVTLRLRAADGDLTGAKVRLYNDRTNEQSLLNLTRKVGDGKYEWWEVQVPPSALPTVYWYRFIAADGTATAYYEDDATRDGGWGMPFATSPDNGWQLTVYDPAFQTPDWIKNAVVYQIFPDRFRDGLTANNTVTGTFFYSETGGTVYRSLQSNWNEVICDPRSAGPCSGTYSKNFYGGDLQGLHDKLDYLQELGVTAIYLNPIFESPSNHKYDTTDFSIIDDNFGDQQTFLSLTTELDNRGMHLILDGVFNHTSSDSIYFDRYGRYPEVGACESQNSPYRSWYYFTDVTPGTGACVGSTGTPNAARYESWFGYDSLPKLRATDPDVRALIYTSGTQSIAPYWMQYADGWRLDVAGDVDPGVTNDPSNDYWEGFRAATRAVNPETYIVGEEWGNASAWTLGDEWDATMNYQYSSALLSFWRDTTFTDNDHNSGSSAGELNPLTPAQVDARLHNWQERYAPPAYYSMMNLLGSHDTSRALFMLDHNAAQISPTLYLNPYYDWSDSIKRLKGVALMQFTLPGAPTIYYGDEVGLVGPPAYAGGKWEDDPYNRQPYPWLDSSGSPFYAHLQTANGQSVLRDYYRMLTAARNTHAALRTGSFDTLKIDDTNKVYAYGRKLPADAAVVIVNRNTTTQTVTVKVGGYLGNGTVFTDVLHSGAVYTVTGGSLTVADVPPMLGALLVFASGDIVAPSAPTNLVATEGSAQVVLDWDAAVDAVSYNLYRSLLSGGGYTRLVTGTADLVYTDTAVSNGTWYYYVATAVDASGNESVYSNEAAALPHASIDWANLQWPPEITHTIGITPTADIYGQVYISGVTSAPGATAGLLAQVGYGPTTTAPSSWTHWVNTTFNGQAGDNDEFKGQFLPEMTGEFYYAYRYSTTGGRDWFYADRSGPISASTVVTPGLLHVISSGDVTPPATPLNLRVTHWGTDHISLAWDPVADGDLYAYDLYRYSDQQLPGEVAQIGRVLAPTAVYTDEAVVGGHTYTYTVKALDTSFNASPASNEAIGKAVPRQVELRFFVTVPTFTPVADTVYIAGDNAAAFGASWNPGATPITKLSATQWMYTVTIGEGTVLLYKYTRGSWDVVENWGSLVGVANRTLTTVYGDTGVMTVTDTVHNWRDPIVMSHSPLDGALLFNNTQPITVAFNRLLNTTYISSSTFVVTNTTGATIAGTFSFAQQHPTSYITSTIVTFTPDQPLPGGDYQVSLAPSGFVDEGPMQQPFSWTFDVAGIAFVSPTNGEVFTATDNISVSVPLVITTTNFAIPADGHWHLWVDGSMVNMIYNYETTQTLLIGPHVITAEMVNTSHQPLGPVVTLDVTVKKLYPYLVYLPIVAR